MRIRSALLALLALLVVAVGVCTAAPTDGPAAVPATTAAPRAAATPKAMVQTRLSPPGLLPMVRRNPAPRVEVTAFDGRTVSLQRLRGRPAVVSFFESWCGTCQAEQPDLTKVAADFAGRVGFVGVSYHAPWPPVVPSSAASRSPVRWPTTPRGGPGLAGGCRTSRSSCWSTSTAGSPSASTAAPPVAPWPPR